MPTSTLIFETCLSGYFRLWLLSENAGISLRSFDPLTHLARKDSCNVRLKKVQTWYEERNVSSFKVKSEFVIFLSTVILSYQKVSRDPRNLWTLTLKSPWNVSSPLCAKVAHSQPWTVQTVLFPCRWLQTPTRWVWMLHRRLLLAQHLLRPKASKVQGVEDVEIPMLSPCSQMFQSYPLHKIGILKYLEHLKSETVFMFVFVLFCLSLLFSNRKEVSHGRLALLALQGLCLSYCNPWRKLVMRCHEHVLRFHHVFLDFILLSVTTSLGVEDSYFFWTEETFSKQLGSLHFLLRAQREWRNRQG